MHGAGVGADAYGRMTTPLPSRTELAPLFILGPTGSGKSAVALELARLLGAAEIVSADAYQVYRGLGVLTAAPSPEERAAVPHHLVDCMEPTENNDAAAHARRAAAAIAAIQARGARPIVTGGSGLYVKFISHGISPAPPSDPALRAELASLPLPELLRRLQEADPAAAAAVDVCNARYVARYLEIVLTGGKPLAHWQQNWREPAGPGWVITRATEELDARLAARSRAMLRGGAIEEVAALASVPLSATAEKTLGLGLIRDCLAGRLSRRDLAPALSLLTRRYAKRQRTWLRREAWLRPLSMGAADSPAAAAARIAEAC